MKGDIWTHKIHIGTLGNKVWKFLQAKAIKRMFFTRKQLAGQPCLSCSSLADVLGKLPKGDKPFQVAKLGPSTYGRNKYCSFLSWLTQ